MVADSRQKSLCVFFVEIFLHIFFFIFFFIKKKVGVNQPRIRLQHCLRVFQLNFTCQFYAHVYRFSEKTVRGTELIFFLVVGYINTEILSESFRSYDISESRYFSVWFNLSLRRQKIPLILLDLMLQELSIYCLPFLQKI